MFETISPAQILDMLKKVNMSDTDQAKTAIDTMITLVSSEAEAESPEPEADSTEPPPPPPPPSDSNGDFSFPNAPMPMDPKAKEAQSILELATEMSSMDFKDRMDVFEQEFNMRFVRATMVS